MSIAKYLVTAGIAASMAVSAVCTSAIPATSTINYNSARAGLYSEQQYLEVLVDSIPELSESKLLAGIVYEPTVSEMIAKSRQANPGIPGLEEVLQNLATFSGPAMANDRFLRTTVFPPHTALYGSGVSMHIIVAKSALKNSVVSNDDELASVLLHELKHIEDLSQGMKFGNGTSLQKNDLLSREVSPNFYMALAELRSYYLQLDRIFRAEHGLNAGKFSEPFIIHTIREYGKVSDALVRLPNTPKEKMLLDAQISDSRGIASTKLPDGSVMVNFNLDGRTGSYTARAK